MPPAMEATLQDASLYAGVAVLLAVVATVARNERRRTQWTLALVALIALLGLWLLASYGGRFDDRTVYEIAREALLALLAIAVLRAVLSFVAHVVLGRLGVPSIVTDVLLGLALIAYALVRLEATGVNLAGIVTTSAVITGAIAFSAKEVLGALWAGLALQLDRTLRLGDWILHDGRSGQITGIRWRTTTIRTRNNEQIIIPNTQLVQDKVHVLARAGSPERAVREIVFYVAYDHPPSRVVATLNEAMHRCEIPNVARDPSPWCICTGLDDSRIAYKLLYHAVDLARARETDSALLAQTMATLRRAGLKIPFPQREVHVFNEAGPDEARKRETDARIAALRAVELFAALTDEERAGLAEAVHPMLYVHGEVLFRQGDAADCLFVLVRGRIAVYDEREPGERRPLAALHAPAYVGEMGLLTGQPRAATVVADGDVECLRVDRAGFDAILRNRPEIVDELSHGLARRQAENDATLQALDDVARRAGERGRAHELMRRIRQFFSLSGAP
jgi:CRP-like cAMP-binding protein/small-conductance mechanosensitive channel